MCDVNNIYVSASNHGWDSLRYIKALPPLAIGEIHLAGHTVRQLDGGQSLRIDDHGSRVAAEVSTLYEQALALFEPVPMLIEWDTNVPPLDVLVEEAARATAALNRMREKADHADLA